MNPSENCMCLSNLIHKFVNLSLICMCYLIQNDCSILTRIHVILNEYQKVLFKANLELY